MPDTLPHAPMTDRTLLIRDADLVVTLDDDRRELRRASV